MQKKRKNKLLGRQMFALFFISLLTFAFYVPHSLSGEAKKKKVSDTGGSSASVVINPAASPPNGPAPTADAIEVETEDAVSMFSAGNDEAIKGPEHPPIAEIPPMPMPDDQEGAATFSEPGKGIIYDQETGETTVIQAESAGSFFSAMDSFEFGGGYCGADGGEGIDDTQASMYSDMTKISNTATYPPRMNAKVVMRFKDSGGYDRFAVCSGTMRDARTVLTAGHCVYNRSYGWGWADRIWVYPGWDGNGGQWNPPPSIINNYGYGTSVKLGSWTGWTGSGDWNNDVGIIALDRAVGNLTGWYGWAWGYSCAENTSRTYYNYSFPAEGCGEPGLHNGFDMYYWSGLFNSCPSWNRLQINTSGGCFNAIWGGMSGGGAYFISGSNRYVHAVCSTSDRSTYGRYVKQWEDWVNWSNNTFIPTWGRGSTFDLQPLDVNVMPSTIQQGDLTTTLNHLVVNPTNGSKTATFTYRVYLSTNDNISSTDTLLSTQTVYWSSAAMSSLRVNMTQVRIPCNTPPGNYYIGVIYDSASDSNSANNDTNGWDAAPITVTAKCPPAPTSISYPTVDCDGNFIVSWSSVCQATSYTLQRKFGLKGIWSTVYGGSSNSFSQAGLSNGSWYYRVKATNSCGSSSYRTGGAVVVSSAPATPASISYPKSSCGGNFTVSWSSTSGATSYTLQRKSGLLGVWGTVYTGSGTSYSQTSLATGTYYYRVRASNTCGSSSYITGSAIAVNSTDADKDGVLACAGDCDDTDPQVFPGAPELCDGKDNDCNALTPDGSGEKWYGLACDGADNDLCREGIYQCIKAQQFCNDDPNEHDIEICGDGLDNDCDRLVDEFCVCDPGQQQACKTDLPGICAEGKQTCSATGQWGDCVPNNKPGPEICDGLDNDCNPDTPDGTDETWYGQSCDGADTDLCEEGKLVCQNRAQFCTDDPAENDLDLCDGLDNDCNPDTPDGSHEEWLGKACDGDDKDLCEEGVFECIKGLRSCTDDPNEHDLDLCDGLDNDCNPDSPDGSGESWFGKDCDGTDTDLCEEGQFICQNKAQFCTDDPTENDLDLCDRLDNDCNPDTPDGADEDWYGQLCDGDDSDLCQEGKILCTDGTRMCSDDPTEHDLDLCDGLDNDCNPDTPDGADEPWLGQECDGTDSDLCAEGVLLCKGRLRVCSDDPNENDLDLCDGVDNDCNPDSPDGSDEPWFGLKCDGADSDLCEEGEFICQDKARVCTDDPTEHDLEICDGLDNDCNPNTPDGSDEAWLGKACDGADRDLCPEGSLECIDGGQTCTDDPTEHDLEICDGLDNDCNPNTPDGSDEAWLGKACDGADSDFCEEGTLECLDAARFCSDDPNEHDLEICDDGIDNDCDGLIDEGCQCRPGDSTPCKTGQPGICNEGTQTCDALGQWGDCIPKNQPGREICDGLDNDCNPKTPDGADETWYGDPCDGADSDLCNEGAMICQDSTRICTDDPNEHDLDLCDGQDNDCNPNTPDGADEPWLGVACDGADTDLCEEGVLECIAGSRSCSDDPNENDEEICFDQIDNDCDGLTDEDCGAICKPGETQTCDTGQPGICADGTQTCDATGYWGDCVPDNQPGPEVCDGLDNDCNPDTLDGADETWMGEACDGADSDMCEEGVFDCRDAGKVCTDDPNEHDVEICDDGIDNDCDGVIDENCADCILDVKDASSAGQEVDVAIDMVNIPNAVDRFTFDVHYDPNIMSFKVVPAAEILWGDCMAQGFSLRDVNLITPGHIRIGATDLGGSAIPAGTTCTIVKLTFTTAATDNTCTTVTLSDPKGSMEGWPANALCPGEVCFNQCIIGDVDQDGDVDIDDVFCLFRSVMGRPSCLDGVNNPCADVDKDGDIDIDDVFCLFRNVMGRPSCMDTL